MPHLNVVSLFDSNAADIAEMLRAAADEIDDEDAREPEATRAIAAVRVSNDGRIRVYGWGATDNFHSLAALHAGAALIARNVVEESLE